MRSLPSQLLLVLLTVMFPGWLNAQKYIEKDSVTVVNPRVYVNAGLYYVGMTTSLRVDSDLGLGTDISLEDDFKMPSQLSVFRTEAVARVKERSQFVFLFTSMKRSRDVSIDEDIEFADTTFYVDADLSTFFNVNYLGFTWRYSVWNKPGWNAGFSVGLRAMNIKAGLEATLNDQSYQRESSVWAPSLLVGIHGAGYLNSRLLARYSMEYFQLNIEGIKANVLENSFSVEYFVLKNVGIGAGYGTSAYVVREIPFNEDFDGKVKLVFGGFKTYLTARF